jgi:hypothetical protein
MSLFGGDTAGIILKPLYEEFTDAGAVDSEFMQLTVASVNYIGPEIVNSTKLTWSELQIILLLGRGFNPPRTIDWNMFYQHLRECLLRGCPGIKPGGGPVGL